MIKVYEEKEAPKKEYALRFKQDETDVRENTLHVVIVDAITGETVPSPYVFSITSNGIVRAYSVNEKAMAALGIAVNDTMIATD
ncbi:hypothetical protein [Cloacibacillus porcorum]